MTAPEVGGWYNYAFKTRLQCALNCPPGAHPLYEGKTNRPWERVLEHAKTQPWFRHACGYDIYPEVYATERLSLEAEAVRIREHLPLANKALNERNLHRLDFGQQVPRPAQARASRPAGRPTVAPRRRSRRQRHASALAGVWVALTVGLWLAACRWLHAPAVAGGEVGAIGATGVLLAAWAQTRPKRAMGRRLAEWVTVGLAVCLLWVLWPVLGHHVWTAAPR